MELPVLSRCASGLIAILLINWIEELEDFCVLVVATGADDLEEVDLWVLQLVAIQARDSMNMRFFNIFSTL